MGGRGASSGISKTGKVYGTEYHTLLQAGNIKFVQTNDFINNNKAPMETMTKGRIYGYVNKDMDLKTLVFFDNKNKRNLTIDIKGKPHKINGRLEMPHVHIGYEHSENGTYVLSKNQKIIVDRAVRIWYNHIDS